ncbi:2-oxoglutarate dehydrogenase E2 component [Gibbsiella quercinecans]|uniref:Dihydrolipoyllysine-residue succinyltransferase component of 2-oxoglutarate dehydrogenase complex n=1 Tax=Gibbsiella quercinecans TaxID=929813 RepID=A0A250B4V9_9GAMM|nr:2-oxoglutarate dehydrogenase complex dihydrolipoyllysine-residue succinyltransferase [Gibbsiella quercinecans]ATA21273.1 dihydrolipoamide succinyltransferase [Gibbsiella quercinecans]RLM07389.1 dihydrolipoamide succinyltransferase [Gibbsiella quercinecans]RLM13444.1 dihydrolipoamide succinyltransferase [Gibbsiella quercinecans]TCT88505.1 2-oxoglutarate dehydrogenase E2 component [Gibbsiella quercinecans]
MIEITAPQLPESVAEGTLTRWCKQPGEAVKRDEVLAELETDKVILEIPAPQDGILSDIVCPEEATVASGQLLAHLQPQTAAAAVAADVAPAPAAPEPAPSAAPPVMPAARQEALRQGIAPEQVAGSGNGGRVLKEDVARAAAAVNRSASAPAPVAVEAPVARGVRREPMSRLRARVAERLLASQRENAILTTFNEVNMQPVMALRQRWKERFAEKHGVKLGFMSFFVKAATYALREFPILNASVDGQEIIWHDYCDVGIAVSSLRGLVVPVLRDTQHMSIADIERQIADYATLARTGKLPLEALQGGTFSVTNGGTFGSMMSTPIINPPQSAILGMHAITPRAVVENDAIVIRPMMYLALSYDHRIIDGQEAVQALVLIRRLLEAPERFLLDL